MKGKHLVLEITAIFNSADKNLVFSLSICSENLYFGDRHGVPTKASFRHLKKIICFPVKNFIMTFFIFTYQTIKKFHQMFK